jgi:hypothetical protein
MWCPFPLSLAYWQRGGHHLKYAGFSSSSLPWPVLGQAFKVKHPDYSWYDCTHILWLIMYLPIRYCWSYIGNVTLDVGKQGYIPGWHHKSIATLPRQTGRTKCDLAGPKLPRLKVIWLGPHRYSPFLHCTSTDGQLVTALFTFWVDCGFCLHYSWQKAPRFSKK